MVVAKKYIYVSQLFISRMPKMRAVPQLVSAPLNPIPIAERFRRSHPLCEQKRHMMLYSIMTMQVPVHGLTKVAHDVKIVNNPVCAGVDPGF